MKKMENKLNRARSETNSQVFDKENICVKAKNMNSVKKGVLEKSRSVNNEENCVTNSKSGILKRKPLQEINLPLQNSFKIREYKEENDKSNTKYSQAPEKVETYKLPSPYIEGDSSSEECSYLAVISRDSLPLSLERLNIQKDDDFIEKKCIVSDFKHVTTEREYDTLMIDDSLIDSFNQLSDESLFFDESIDFNERNAVGEDLPKRKMKKGMGSMVLGIPKFDDIKATPMNHGVLEFQGIKQIRKNAAALRDTHESPSVNSANCQALSSTTLYNSEDATVVNFLKNKKCLISKIHESSALNKNAASPVVYVEQKILDKPHKSALNKVAGAVVLDVQDNFVFHEVLYSTVYLEFIVNHLLHKELKYHLSSSFLKKYFITDLNRSIVINWLIKLQTYMRTDHLLVYTAVRLMDRTIDSFEIPLNMLQLVALASFWLGLKFHSTNQKEIKWMVKQSGGAYTVTELAEMERLVFQANKFDVGTVDSSTLIHYYILNLHLPNANIIAQCSHYLLDCALLNSRFVRTLPSMMASAAVFTSLHLMKQYTDQLWMRLCFYCGYYTPDELKTVKLGLLEVLREVNNPSFPCREPYYKYCSSRYCSIAYIVLDALSNDFE